MTCKRLVLLCVLLSFLTLGARAEEKKVVVYYDYALSDAISEVVNFAVYTSWKADYVQNGTPADLSQYDAAVVYLQEDTELNEAVASQLRGKQLMIIGQGGVAQLAGQTEEFGGTITLRPEGSSLLVRGEGLRFLSGEDVEQVDGLVYIDETPHPLYARRGRISHLACYQPEKEMMRTFLDKCLGNWIDSVRGWKADYGWYLVLDNVYPYLDTQKLLKITNMLAEENVPYALSVMPIFRNAEYPAMKKFCEYLRYEQARGAGIILHAPLVSLSNVPLEEAKENIGLSYSAYTRYGVYPLAFQAADEYIHHAKGLDLLRSFRMIFLFEAEHTMPEQMTGNLAYADGHMIVAPRYGSASDEPHFAQAIYLNTNEEVETLREQVIRLKKTGTPLLSMRELHQSVYINASHVALEGGILYENGEQVSLEFTPFDYDDGFVFDRGMIWYFTNQIETSNRFIIFFVLISSSAFMVMVVLSRRLLRAEILRGYQKKTEKRKNGGKGKCS